LIENYFTQPKVVRRIRAGLASRYLDEFVAELEAQHYSRKSIRRQLRNADAFGRWIAQQEVPWSEVTGAVVARYVAPMHRTLGPSRRQGYRAHNAPGLSRFLALLRRHKAVPPEATVAPSSLNCRGSLATQSFNQHLERVAEKRASTCRRYPGVGVRVFLRFLSTRGVVQDHLV